MQRQKQSSASSTFLRDLTDQKVCVTFVISCLYNILQTVSQILMIIDKLCDRVINIQNLLLTKITSSIYKSRAKSDSLTLTLFNIKEFDPQSHNHVIYKVKSAIKYYRFNNYLVLYIVTHNLV